LALFTAVQHRPPCGYLILQAASLNLPSENLTSFLLEIDQPIEVVAASHHSHYKVCSGLTNGTYRFSSHRFDGPKYVLYPCFGYRRVSDAAILSFQALMGGSEVLF